MPESEFRGWIEFYGRHPWGPESDYYRTGIVASLIHNVNLDPKARQNALKPSDFVPGKKKVSPEDGLDSKKVRSVLHSVFGTPESAKNNKGGKPGGRSDRLQDTGPEKGRAPS